MESFQDFLFIPLEVHVRIAVPVGIYSEIFYTKIQTYNIACFRKIAQFNVEPYRKNIFSRACFRQRDADNFILIFVQELLIPPRTPEQNILQSSDKAYPVTVDSAESLIRKPARMPVILLGLEPRIIGFLLEEVRERSVQIPHGLLEDFRVDFLQEHELILQTSYVVHSIRWTDRHSVLVRGLPVFKALVVYKAAASERLGDQDLLIFIRINLHLYSFVYRTHVSGIISYFMYLSS